MSTHTYTTALQERYWCLTKRRAMQLAADLRILEPYGRHTKVEYEQVTRWGFSFGWIVKLHG